MVVAALVAMHRVEAIGEGVVSMTFIRPRMTRSLHEFWFQVDLNTLLGIFGGMANIFTNFNTTEIDTDRIMGKWHQVCSSFSNSDAFQYGARSPRNRSFFCPQMYKAAINFDVFQTNMYCHVAYCKSYRHCCVPASSRATVLCFSLSQQGHGPAGFLHGRSVPCHWQRRSNRNLQT